MKTFVSGSIGFDDLEFSNTCLRKVLGGSGVYAALGASIFSEVVFSGIVGKDFPKKYLSMLESKGINIDLLQKSKSPSFRWKARYSDNLSDVATVGREMNALLEFDPKLIRDKKSLKDCKVAFISKDDPEYQIELIGSLPKDTLIVADTMRMWMVDKKEALYKTLKHVDVFLVDESEASLMVDGRYSTPELIEKIMLLGPKVVIYKRGEHGFMMYGKMGNMVVPGYPMTYAVDPTGAGDALGGAIAGVLSSMERFDEPSMKTAVFLASVVSSFLVEDYGTRSLEELTLREIINRSTMFLSQLPSLANLRVKKVNGKKK